MRFRIQPIYTIEMRTPDALNNRTANSGDPYLLPSQIEPNRRPDSYRVMKKAERCLPATKTKLLSGEEIKEHTYHGAKYWA
ncbi:hypothetical protein hamaS1_07370 [Moorella sp. Hama-1]|nr:hypothetical protein hamaS1_07370 [Moorella sp. Hama-1]